MFSLYFGGEKGKQFVLVFFSSYSLVLISYGLDIVIVLLSLTNQIVLHLLLYLYSKFDLVLQISVNSLLVSSGLRMLLKFILHLQGQKSKNLENSKNYALWGWKSFSSCGNLEEMRIYCINLVSSLEYRIVNHSGEYIRG